MTEENEFDALGIPATQQTEVDGKKLEYRELNPGEIRKIHSFTLRMNQHICRRGMTAQDVVDRSRIENIPVVSLCGESLVPDVDLAGLETCSDCVAIAKFILENLHDND